MVSVGLLQNVTAVAAGGTSLSAPEYGGFIARYHKAVSSGHKVTPAEARAFQARFASELSVQSEDGSKVIPDNQAEVTAMKRIADTPKGSEPDEETRSRVGALNRIVHPVVGSSLNGAKIGAVASGVLRGGEFNYHKTKIPRAKLGWLKRWLKGVSDSLGRFFDWLFGGLGKKTPKGPDLSGFALFVRYFFFALLFIAVAAACAFFGLKLYQNRDRFRRKRPILTDTGLDLGPDEVGDPIAAAHRLADRGDYRGAIRLAYIASLRALSTAGSITITSHRTNWEYQRELNERAAEKSAILQPATALFDRVWYGHRTGTAAEFALAISVYERLVGAETAPDATAMLDSTLVGSGQGDR